MGIRTAIPVGLVLLCVMLSSLRSAPSTRPAEEAKANTSSITVLFSPEDDCIGAIVEELNAATRSIHVRAYVLTSDAIGDALVAAKQRGLEVRVISERKLPRRDGGVLERLVRSKVAVRVDALPSDAHNEIIIIDRSAVITGSVRSSGLGLARSTDNLLIIKDYPEVARRFNQNWARHLKPSLPPYGAKPGLVTDETTTEEDSAVGTGGEPTATDGQDLVYVTRYGKRYHRPDCQFARNAGEAVTREDAGKQGKTPCKICKPE